jgi:pimeloyl-ACP methyl ester carboxylesterase
LPPGGPGIGSESRQSLAEAIDVPVVTWLVGHVRRRIEGGAHFPWIEQPDAVRAAVQELAAVFVEYRRE